MPGEYCVMRPLPGRRDRRLRGDHLVCAEMPHQRADHRGQRYGRGGGQGARGITRADLPCGHCAVAAHQDDCRHGDVADGGIADLAGAQDRAKQRWRQTPGGSPVDQQEGDQEERRGPDVIRRPQQVRHVRLDVKHGGHHGDHDTAAGHPGQAPAARQGHGHGTDRDDQVRERGGNVAGQVAQPEKDLSNGEHRQVKGVIRRVADDPPVQQEMTVQHVPRLQRIVRPVRSHGRGERDPQVEGKQRHAADDPHRRRQQVAHPAVSGASRAPEAGRRQPSSPGIERICIRRDPPAPDHGPNHTDNLPLPHHPSGAPGTRCAVQRIPQLPVVGARCRAASLAPAGGMFFRSGGPKMTALPSGETGCWHDRRHADLV